MRFLYSYHTDIGRKKTNQDSCAVVHRKLDGKTYLLAIVCDGVGGLSQGEYASNFVTKGFVDWFVYELPLLLLESDFESALRIRWSILVDNLNAT